MEFVWPLAIFAVIFASIVYFLILRPFVQGVREGMAKRKETTPEFPENCPMCGEVTLMTRQLRCAHCGESLRPKR